MLALFRRPDGRASFDQYSHGLRFPAAVDRREEIESVHLASMVALVYGDADSRVCVPTDSASTVESHCLAIWNQQWPALRREFSFTTAMLGGGIRRFDLQAIPSKNRRLFQGKPEFTFADATMPLIAGWVMSAVQDAVGASGSRLRSFLWEFGPAFESGRAAFRGLSEVFEAAQDVSAPASKAYLMIGTYFRGAAEAHEMVEALFGGTSQEWSLDEVDALEVIARDTSDDLGETDRNFERRIVELTTEALESLWHRLHGARNLRVGITTRMLVARVTARSTNSVAEVVGRHPELCDEPFLWQSLENHWPALASAPAIRGRVVQSLICGLLHHGPPSLLFASGSLVEIISPSVWVRSLRSCIETRGLKASAEDLVLRSLWKCQEEIRSELKLGGVGQFLKVAAAALDLSPVEIQDFPLDGNPIGPTPLPKLHDSGAELHASAFLLAIGLVRRDSAAAGFMREGFSTIYIAAKHQRLPWDLWRRLEPELPWHFLEWDRCARLIEGCVARFSDLDWPTSEFLLTFAEDEEFDRALDVLLSHSPDYLDSLLAVESAFERITEHQRKRLEELRRSPRH
jgi:hypothetical protein